MSLFQRFQKRLFDIFFSIVGLFLLGWLIILAALIARADTGSSGFFLQIRVGKDGKLFKLIKIRSMIPSSDISTNVTASSDVRISKLGRFWRNTKIDELPQLWNVLIGDMSFVGPRPDVPGFADLLQGENRLLLKIRPGITGPATIQFRNEEEILAAQSNPEQYNLEVLWPMKVEINMDYFKNYSFQKDIKLIIKTVFG
jgi:lipopolysaccharide/colanic/teichoic acid biosynthesis glycosyltransferase